ncbi:helix-turn-helix transcriptional regulator [Nonomuraea sp. PA05]|uniref:helix-turn-helix domain-containing protein n=1 Tax=Nonomuraea sp. PA05 TaxID=2604466 RepID=UPI0011D31EC0|nr:helix-turn-helix transcriptional regulator [Nonomuraea sp. PA05]TYB50651.1 helix-turn-helix transcriptional regulator [Nonomuraea sp. PA05]
MRHDKGKDRELAAFLQSRRARLRPEDVGLAASGERRRVPGLRREELAALAGVSIAHYTRLEQGNARNVSAAVLDAVARALRLTEDERLYLHRRAHPEPAPPVETPALRPGLRQLLASMETVPALILDSDTTVVAWNRLGAALWADFAVVPRERRSISHLLFLNADFRRLHGDQLSRVAREAVAHLRTLAARYPGDAALAAHIARMRAESPEFDGLWNALHVRGVTHRVYRLEHPQVGAIEVHGELLPLPDDPPLRLDLFTTVPGSASQAALRRLAAVGTRPASQDC